EPAVLRSVAAGCAVVCFSGDKLLGGPQAGVTVGAREAIERCRSHPLARAVRVDKLSLAALEATLQLYRDPAAARREVPVLRMLTAGESELAARAELMREAIVAGGVDARVIRASAKAGGGALPLLELEGPVCAVDPGAVGADELARRLRASDPPVDVPGHERFVRTMVAGASGVDLFLFCVAADDGVMPQTREHLAVLRQLGVAAGVVAITKSDLVDPELAAEEVRQLLPDAPTVAV